MSRHAVPGKQRVRRSPSARAAYQAGLVTGTLDLTRPASLTVRERAMRTAARYGAALGLMAGMIWIYDIARVLHG
jgi:hypothetical protein